MEVFSCAASAASLGRNCLSTTKTLYDLYEKFQDARRTIAALHMEVAVIGASMQFINVIFEEHQELIHLRFTKIPDLEQTFVAALAGCNLVLSCLDDELEAISSRMGPDGSKDWKGRTRLLWRGNALQDLLQSLRGQQSAIFTIIQCLHLQNIAQLGEKFDDLRAKVSDNHPKVEKAVRASPSVANLRPESSMEAASIIVQSTLESEVESVFDAPSLAGTGASSSSSKRVASSYREYRATLSNISIQQAGDDTQSVAETVRWGDNQDLDDTASIFGLAPSTVMASHDPQKDDQSCDKQSIVSLGSTFSRTRDWLENLSLSERSTGLRQHPRSAVALSETSAEEIEHSIIASDVESFLQHIRYFMPALAESDDRNEGRQAQDGLAEADTEQDAIDETGLKTPLAQALEIDSCRLPDDHISQIQRPYTDLWSSTPAREDMPAEIEIEQATPSVVHEGDVGVFDVLRGIGEEIVQNDNITPIGLDASEVSVEPKVDDPHFNLNVCVGKRQYHQGKVMNSSNLISDPTRRVSYGFSQTYVSGKQDKISSHDLGLNIVFVRTETLTGSMTGSV